MQTHSIRCPGCSAEMQMHQGVLGSIHNVLARNQKCGACGHIVALRDAKIMGEAFGYWRSQLRGRLRNAALHLPKISPAEAAGLFLCANAAEALPRAETGGALCNMVEHIYQGLLLDGAHGHAAELEVVLLEEAQNPKFVGVFGFSSAHQPARFWTVLVARVGGDSYVLHSPEKMDERIRQWLPNSEAWGGMSEAWNDEMPRNSAPARPATPPSPTGHAAHPPHEGAIHPTHVGGSHGATAHPARPATAGTTSTH